MRSPSTVNITKENVSTADSSTVATYKKELPQGTISQIWREVRKRIFTPGRGSYAVRLKCRISVAFPAVGTTRGGCRRWRHGSGR